MKAARCALALAVIAGAGAATAKQDAFYGFRAEMENPGQEWVVISNHYRHSNDCTSYGCVIIGPTENRDACKEWSSLYNRVNPLDHSRCVSAESYDIPRY